MINWKKPIVEETISLLPNCGIGIDNNPIPSYYYDSDSYRNYRVLITGKYFSIYVNSDLNEKPDCSEFWDLYNTVIDSKKWQVYVALCKD